MCQLFLYLCSIHKDRNILQKTLNIIGIYRITYASASMLNGMAFVLYNSASALNDLALMLYGLASSLCRLASLRYHLASVLRCLAFPLCCLASALFCLAFMLNHLALSLCRLTSAMINTAPIPQYSTNQFHYKKEEPPVRNPSVLSIYLFLNLSKT